MLKFFYNIDNKKLWLFSHCNHPLYWNNHKAELNKGFDYYIRGIIKGDNLYLRLYYPYEDIGEKTFTELKQASNELLEYSKPDILRKLKDNNISIKETFLNVTNEDLLYKLKLQWV